MSLSNYYEVFNTSSSEDEDDVDPFANIRILESDTSIRPSNLLHRGWSCFCDMGDYGDSSCICKMDGYLSKMDTYRYDNLFDRIELLERILRLMESHYYRNSDSSNQAAKAGEIGACVLFRRILQSTNFSISMVENSTVYSPEEKVEAMKPLDEKKERLLEIYEAWPFLGSMDLERQVSNFKAGDRYDY